VVTGLAPEMPRFSSRPVHVGFVVYKMALGQDFLPVLQFSPFSIIPPMLHTHSTGCNWPCTALSFASVFKQLQTFCCNSLEQCHVMQFHSICCHHLQFCMTSHQKQRSCFKLKSRCHTSSTRVWVWWKVISRFCHNVTALIWFRQCLQIVARWHKISSGSIT